MTQQNQHIQSVNDLVLDHPEVISTFECYEENEYNIKDYINKLRWTTLSNKILGGDSEIEKQETIQAYKELISQGIISSDKLTYENKTKEPPKKNKQYQLVKNKLGTSAHLVDKTTGNKKKVGPNEPCPCGSGKKFKKCHGRGIH